MIKKIPISAVYPVVPTYAWDYSISLGSSGATFSADDGFGFYESSISDQFTDIKMNRNTILQLINKNDIASVLFENTPESSGLIGNYTILATHQATSAEYESAFSVDDDGVLSAVPLDNADIRFFTLIVSGDDVAIRYGDSAWTYSNATSSVGLSEYQSLSTQQFQISHLSDGFHTLKQDGNIIHLSANSIPLSCFGFSPDGINAKTVALTEIINTGFDTQNIFVTYENIYRPEFSRTESILTPKVDPIVSVPLNYLLTAPYYSIQMPSGDQIEASLPFDIIPLKNFKTINSDQNVISYNSGVWWDRSIDHAPWDGSLVEGDPNNIWNDYTDYPETPRRWADFSVSGENIGYNAKINYRTYEKIYSGASQLEGYPEIHLGYSSEYGMIISLQPDQYSYFHMPLIAVEQTISDANLVRIGATAGTTPAQSDRIYKRLAEYNSYIWWGGDGNKTSDGTWLCAWLSGSETDAVWKERYYNPGKISYSAAMTVDGDISGQFTATSGDIITDVDSNMLLSPGTYYKYYHVGKATMESQLNDLIKSTDKILELKDFVQDSAIINDSSTYNNDGNILNPTKAIVTSLELSFIPTNTPAILLGGTSEINVPTSIYFDTQIHRSTLTWVYMDDWINTYKHNKSCAIYSNYFNGGDKLEYIDHGLYYSSILPNATSATSGNKIAILQTDFNAVTSYTTPTELSGLSFAVDLDGYGWACGSIGTDTMVYKYAADGTCIANAQFNTMSGTKIGIIDDNYGYIHETSTNTLYNFNLHTLSISSTTGLTGLPYLAISGSVSATNVEYIDMFADGTTCTLSGGILKIGGVSKNAPTSPSGLSMEHVCCDDDTYYYVTTKNMGSDYYLFRRAKAGKDWEQLNSITYTLTAIAPAINRVFISRETIDEKIQNIINWIKPDGTVEKSYDVGGTWTSIKTITLTWDSTMTVYDSDFSGYKLNKIHNVRNDSQPRLKYSVQVLSGDNILKSSVSCPVSGLVDSWHHIGAVMGSSGVSLHINGTLGVENTTAPNTTLRYFSGSCYNIGSDIIADKSITTAMNTNIGRFSGGIADHTVYNLELSAATINTIYNINYFYNVPIQWVVKTQARNFVENIKSLYKFKLPGSKSQFYDIVVRNSNIADADKPAYETLIRETAKENTPDYIKLKGIIWK